MLIGLGAGLAHLPSHGATWFDGIDDVAELGVIDHNYPITYAAWMKPTDVTHKRFALGRYWSGYALGVHSERYRFHIYLEGTAYVTTVESAVAGEWAHMAVTYDGTTVTYYVNGVAEDTDETAGDLSQTDEPWQMGAHGNNNDYFEGYIDTNHVRILHDALDSNGVLRLYYTAMDPAVTRYDGLPSGTLPSGIAVTNLSLRTYVNATCRYSTTPGVEYDSMTNTFATTGGTLHTTPITGLADGNVYRHYVRCRDESGRTNTNDYEIAFSAGLMSYYVAGTNGSDKNDGLTPATAWRTFNKANETVSPGHTVYIVAGTYEETIQPRRSGTAEHCITYTRNGDDEVVIRDVHTAIRLDNTSYVVVDGLRCVNCRWVRMETNSTHNIIKNCHFQSDDIVGGIIMRNGTDYNKVLNNMLIGTNMYDLIDCTRGCSYNLFESNHLEGATHFALHFQSRDGPAYHNVIRGNTLVSRLHNGLCLYTSSNYGLVERNLFYDCGADETGTVIHAGFQLGASHCIIRNNVFVDNWYALTMGTSSGGSTSFYNRVYNNTFMGNKTAIFHNTVGPLHDNVFKNNILYNQTLNEVRRTVLYDPDDDLYVNNDILGAPVRWDPDGEQPLAYWHSNYPDNWRDNLALNPKFVDAPNRDLGLHAESPMIDMGAWLTTAASSGSGTNIPLVDARYFTDGHGVIDGDLVQLEGQTQRARVTSVDYTNNIITVDQSMSWSAGLGIGIPYEHRTPDIGAYEYSGSLRGTVVRMR